MPDYHHLVHLDDLIIEELHILQIGLLTDLLHGSQEHGVVSLWEGDPREQIGYDAVEQGDVVGQELGQVHVQDGTQELGGGFVKLHR